MIALLTTLALAQDPTPWSLRLEGGALWQGKNDAQIPGDGGTGFSISKFGGVGPLPVYRVYFGRKFGDNHQVRLLYAPFENTVSGTPGDDLHFNNHFFNQGQPTEVTYRFNSYRATYRYSVVNNQDWRVGLGFSGKVRDAVIGVSQNGRSTEYTNIGFVPLLSFGVQYQATDKVMLELDGDASWAPQGRAEDIRLSVVYQFSPLWAMDVGYRTLEGGADNPKVNTFSWFHYAIVGLRFGAPVP